jgi:hypothetical protein
MHAESGCDVVGVWVTENPTRLNPRAFARAQQRMVRAALLHCTTRNVAQRVYVYEWDMEGGGGREATFMHLRLTCPAMSCFECMQHAA